MTITVDLECPNCGRPATAVLRRDLPDAHAEVVAYSCPAGCRVDDEAIRQVTGTSGT